MIRLFLAVGVLVAATFATAAEPAKFELQDGDRVVFLGNTLIEREQKYGYWELMLTMAWPERNVTFRNLGWSGDTVWGESRAGFGTQADGFKALVEQVNAAKPTVIFVGYGNVEAFDGEAGLPRFVEGFNKLLDELEKTKARIVLLSPIQMQGRSKPIINIPNEYRESYNRLVDRYTSAMRNLANHRSLRLLKSPTCDYFLPMTVDGLQPNGIYYRFLAEQWAEQLGLPGLEGLSTVADAVHSQSEESLLATIIKKNELFFHRWRPQNETYLFGFRKHEQGNNAKEVFEFDPLVAAEEKKIAELRTKLAAEMKKASESK